MATEIRAKEDFRMMSPDRDLKHCLVPMMKGAAQLTEIAFKEDGTKITALSDMVGALCEAVNDAKLPTSGTVMDVLKRAFTDIKKVDPEVQLMFMSSFMYITLCRYIAGLRETTTQALLSEKDILDISITAGVALFIPEEFQHRFSEKMRDRSMWGCLDDLGTFQISEVSDIPPEVLKKEYDKDES